MGDVIKRIMEAEQACSNDVENARLARIEGIDRLTNELENKKIQAKNEFAKMSKEKFKAAVDETKNIARIELDEIQKQKGRLIQDKKLNEMVKEKIVSIILAS